MKLPRRQFLHLAAGAVAIPAVPRIARAQTYPTRPITLIVPFPRRLQAHTGASLEVIRAMFDQTDGTLTYDCPDTRRAVLTGIVTNKATLTRLSGMSIGVGTRPA
jgi:hypothetical protein